MDLMEMKLAAARQEAMCNAQVLTAIDQYDAAKVALKEAKRYVKQCKEKARAAIEEKAKAVGTAKALGVSLVGDGDSSEKVGAGGTTVCSDCGRPFAQALGETATCQCSGGLQDNCTDDVEKRKEDAKWFAETYLKIRECSRAKEDELRAKFEAVIRESVSAALQEARLQLAREHGTLLLNIQKKAQDLQSLQPESAGAQGLLEDVRALSEAIGKTS